MLITVGRCRKHRKDADYSAPVAARTPVTGRELCKLLDLRRLSLESPDKHP